MQQLPHSPPGHDFSCIVPPPLLLCMQQLIHLPRAWLPLYSAAPSPRVYVAACAPPGSWLPMYGATPSPLGYAAACTSPWVMTACVSCDPPPSWVISSLYISLGHDCPCMLMRPPLLLAMQQLVHLPGSWLPVSPATPSPLRYATACTSPWVMTAHVCWCDPLSSWVCNSLYISLGHDCPCLLMQHHLLLGMQQLVHLPGSWLPVSVDATPSPLGYAAACTSPWVMIARVCWCDPLFSWVCSSLYISLGHDCPCLLMRPPLLLGMQQLVYLPGSCLPVSADATPSPLGYATACTSPWVMTARVCWCDPLPSWVCSRLYTSWVMIARVCWCNPLPSWVCSSLYISLGHDCPCLLMRPPPLLGMQQLVHLPWSWLPVSADATPSSLGYAAACTSPWVMTARVCWSDPLSSWVCSSLYISLGHDCPCLLMRPPLLLGMQQLLHLPGSWLPMSVDATPPLLGMQQLVYLPESWLPVSIATPSPCSLHASLASVYQQNGGWRACIGC